MTSSRSVGSHHVVACHIMSRHCMTEETALDDVTPQHTVASQVHWTRLHGVPAAVLHRTVHLARPSGAHVLRGPVRQTRASERDAAGRLREGSRVRRCGIAFCQAWNESTRGFATAADQCEPNPSFVPPVGI